LVLTGALAGDDGYAQVGVALAEMLGIPHAAMVKKLEPIEDLVRVNRELEGGLEEVLEVKLPALFTIQTGINEPRYVSIMGIRKARKKEITVLNLKALQMEADEVGESGSWVKVERMFIPPVEKEAEFFEGTPDEVASRIVEILRSRGLV
jgi:electron transfer flavoprotein beta subunit